MEDKEKLYWSIEPSLAKGMAFNLVIGGRGCGKSYGILKKFYELYYNGDDRLNIEKGHPFIYIRRLESTIKTVCTKKGNPFKKLNKDLGLDVQPTYSDSQKIGEFTDNKTGELIGYIVPLSVFAKAKGSDFSDVCVGLMDEFIKEPEEKVFAGENDAFLRAYETICRNREEEGCEAVKFFLVSNATDLASPLLVELGLIPIIENMRKNKMYVATIKERDLRIELVSKVRILEEKKNNSALGRLTNGTNYARHAFDNEFSYNSFSNICKQSLKNYKPLAQFEDVYIYYRPGMNLFYACKSKAQCTWKYNIDTVVDFKRRFGFIIGNAMYAGACMYDSYDTKVKLEKVWKPYNYLHA